MLTADRARRKSYQALILEQNLIGVLLVLLVLKMATGLLYLAALDHGR